MSEEKKKEQVSLATFPYTVEGENRDEADIWAQEFTELLRQKLADAESKSKEWSQITYSEGKRDAYREMLGLKEKQT